MGAVPESHPIQLVVRHDDLRRNRLMVLFRALLALPHAAWLALWSLAAVVAVVAAGFAALARGRVPPGLHRFLAAYVRYATHVLAFLFLVGRRFPDFTGREGYDPDLEIPNPVEQARWKTLLRPFLAVPALLLTGALVGLVAPAVALLAWWCALVTGRMPEGFHGLCAACLRYGAQTYGYLFLLTDRYPDASSVLLFPHRAEDAPPTTATRGLDRAGVAIVCGLVAGVLLLSVLGARSIDEPSGANGALHVLAPADGCWSVALGRTEEDLGARVESGCGPTRLDVDLPLEAQFSKRPPDATWDLGARLEADGEVVREVTPRRYWGLRIRYGNDMPTKTIDVRVAAVDGGCWTATIDAESRQGCGDWTFPLDVEGSVNMIFEREQPGAWAFGLTLVADGRVVQTVGPTTEPGHWLSAVYIVPREGG